MSAAQSAGLATRAQFTAGLRAALDDGRGWAAGKLGGTERGFLLYPIVHGREIDSRRVAAFDLLVGQVGLRHGGVFPATREFLPVFANAYAEAAGRLDSIGVDPAFQSENDDIFGFHGLAGQPIHYLDQEPDRSLPHDEGNCWLPFLRRRRLLLVCPFAELLRERANRATFEAVWRKTGKPWFEPSSVEAVELPYGFARATQERFETALDLLADVRARVAERDFDVALIAAGPLGEMLAVAAKSHGRVGFSLGGHLQVLFGVLGRRWRALPEWERDYVNEAWIDMPERYRPDPAETDEDYW